MRSNNRQRTSEPSCYVRAVSSPATATKEKNSAQQPDHEQTREWDSRRHKQTEEHNENAIWSIIEELAEQTNRRPKIERHEVWSRRRWSGRPPTTRQIWFVCARRATGLTKPCHLPLLLLVSGSLEWDLVHRYSRLRAIWPWSALGITASRFEFNGHFRAKEWERGSWSRIGATESPGSSGRLVANVESPFAMGTRPIVASECDWVRAQRNATKHQLYLANEGASEGAKLIFIYAARRAIHFKSGPIWWRASEEAARSLHGIHRRFGRSWSAQRKLHCCRSCLIVRVILILLFYWHDMKQWHFILHTDTESNTKVT